MKILRLDKDERGNKWITAIHLFSANEMGGTMNNDFQKKLVLIAVVAGVILALYYLMSPYQNCVRGLSVDADYQRVVGVCLQNTDW